MNKPIKKADVEEELTKLGRMLNKDLVLIRGFENTKIAWINQRTKRPDGEIAEWHFCGFYDQDMTSKELHKCFIFAQTIIKFVMKDATQLLNNIENRWDSSWADLDKYLRHWMR